ncbi:hypothetical protein Vi05172_g4508 [Venturia inaequalis]|uniref:Anaphase-promoting complex subunit 4-like WD40 domain-containing protein n=1 Tax=Venturia inaequalis TaxID=5025 RepID=A0A8H3ZF32_VENIN|nr:hypothetical protein EG327_002219 [Venturia inaequalis]RDI85758.1 hypothetical protein Vi05172_g4508 [Venturia inaequalis]
MATSTQPTKIPKFIPPKPGVFTHYIKRQKTTTYPDSLTNARSTPNSNIVRTLAWSPLGQNVATVSGERTLRVWNVEKSGIRSAVELRAQAGGNSGPSNTGGSIDRVAWNPTKENELASCGTDGVVRFWDVRTRGCIGEVKLGGECFTLAWRPNGEDIVVGNKDDWIHSVSRTTLSTLHSQREPTQANQALFSHSGEELFLTTGEGTIKIFDYPNLKTIHTLTAHTSSCYSIALSSPGTWLATGGSDALITLWDTTDFVCKKTFDRAQGPVKTLSFSCDGTYLAGGSDEGNGIEIINVETGEYVHKIETSGKVPLVEWSPRDYAVAYAPLDSGGGLKIVGALGTG